MVERNIEAVEEYFRKKELGLKPIPATTQFRARLIELLEGRQVPVVMFNCLDFSWQQANTGAYPRSTILDDVTKGNIVYYQDTVIDLTRQFRTLGNPTISVIIPDSELFDDRPFNFVQDLQTRQAICGIIQQRLADKLSYLQQEAGAEILTWSEYCARFVPIPWTPNIFTQNEYDRIGKIPELAKKVRDQAKDSRKHFFRRGLNPDYINSIPDEEMVDRTRWYCAMYMGEGVALSLSKALVLNLEDSRVKSWYIKGSSNLPILTPVDPNDYYGWRNQTKE